MEHLLQKASVHPEQVGYVNAHATRTQIGDRAEMQAVHDVFKECTNSLCVSSTKVSRVCPFSGAGSDRSFTGSGGCVGSGYLRLRAEAWSSPSHAELGRDGHRLRVQPDPQDIRSEGGGVRVVKFLWFRWRECELAVSQNQLSLFVGNGLSIAFRYGE